MPYVESLLHGHRVGHRDEGPAEQPAQGVWLLLHGIAGSCQTWDPVIADLARSSRVIAPDLLGHGGSAKPRGDYSLGAFASGVRDLLDLLDIDRVTVAGHSLGGGIAMQFAYQFPDRCERLVLVSSGGLGREVSPLLRAATLPGAELVVPLLGRLARRTAGAGSLIGPGAQEFSRSFASLADAQAGAAFVRTARSVLDLTGQRIDARDRLYLAETIPTMFVWGGRDHIIPVEHGRQAAALVPGSRLEIFHRAGHFPMCDQPQRFVRVLLDFHATTEPASYDRDRIRELVRRTADATT